MKNYIAFLLCIVCALSSTGCSRDSGLLAAPDYPKMAPYPNVNDYTAVTGDVDMQKYLKAEKDYRETLDRQRLYEFNCTGLEEYFFATARELLSDPLEQNIAYSPVNMYIALGMLAEVTDGSSRQQILTLLGEEDVETVRMKCKSLWNACYRDTGATTSIPASSIWLQNDYPYHEEVISTLAKDYYASSFSGEMGTEQYSKALQNWLNDNTGGLLSDASKEIKLSKDTRIALATTLYFCAGWFDEFSENRTENGIFHLADESLECDFMYQSFSRNYYWGDKFSAVKQSFQAGGGMWFILPDEGVSVSELITDSEATEFILSDGDWDKNKNLTVNLSVPKFDVSSTIDLSAAMHDLGIKDVFDITVSDFTPLTNEPLSLSEATHSVRVKIDEEGCEAAAFTVMALAGAAMPPTEEVDFVLDRPFLFVITSDSGLPLFIGVVNRPV